MAKPKRVYYVEQRNTKLRYGQKGGGLFSTLSGMLGRDKSMRQQGGETKLFYADVEWTEFQEEE